jgi:CBS domain-containing protein
MAAHHDDAEGKRPVLVRTVVRADGTRTIGFRVFCARTCSSVTLESCRQCDKYLGEQEDALTCVQSVRCRSFVTKPSSIARSDAVDAGLPGASVAAGKLLGEGPSCVTDDVRAPMIQSSFRSGSDVLIVSEGMRLVGIVREIHLVRAAEKGLPPQSSRGSQERSATSKIRFSDISAADIMTSSSVVVESASARQALYLMVHSHLRSIPVVTLQGEPIGILSDVAALRALAPSHA